MSIHEKLLEQLDLYHKKCSDCGSYALIHAMDSIDCGAFDPILGVKEPTLEDVRRELDRCLPGYWLDAESWSDGGIDVYDDEPRHDYLMMRFHNVESAYAALRVLPDYKEGE